MSETISHIKTETPSEKSFGIVFSIIFLLISLYLLIHSESYHYWALIVSALFLCLAFFTPKLLSAPNRLWFKFGLLLGSIIAPIIMILIYFFTIFPTGLFMRLLGKDLLNKKLDKSSKTYWIERTDSMGTMKNQY